MAKTIALDVTTSQAGSTTLLGKVQSALCDRLFNTMGLAIGTGSKKKVKIVNKGYCLVNGSLLSVAAATEVTLPATSVTNGKYNVIAIYATATDTASAVFGTEGATLADVVLPTIPANSAVCGLVIVHPTGTGAFVGASTDLDDATVVPNAVYIDTPAGFNPNMLSL